MKYHIQEGRFDVPDDGRIDRSMNVLAMPDGSGTTLIVSRDALREQESLAQFVTRQMNDLTRQVSQLKEVSRTDISVGPVIASLRAIELATQFRQNGQALHQRQAVFVLPQDPAGKAVLILTASSPVPFDADALALWWRTLESFQPRA
ncbi:DcrB-related protein [Variovorax sp. AB1(2024)]|uniref:DcrB-related protein n=1 Tax=Variovorax sp. AB1(2024) TaxID=3132214 RepID=UPI0030ADFF12